MDHVEYVLALQKENEELKNKIVLLQSQLADANRRLEAYQHQVATRYRSQEDYVPYPERED